MKFVSTRFLPEKNAAGASRSTVRSVEYLKIETFQYRIFISAKISETTPDREPRCLVPEAIYGPLADLSEHGLELGEGFLDWIEVGAVGREEPQGCTGGFDQFLHRCPLVARQVVHDDDVTGPQFRYQHLADIGLEPVAVDRAIEHHRRNYAGRAQTGHQRGRLAMAVREAHPQALALGAAAMAAGHVGRGPGLVDEHEPLGIEIELAIEPVVPLLQDVGPVLLDCMASPFLRVMP